MKNNFQHIETAIISRPSGSSYGYMYSMHKYWSKKSADVVAAYIERYSNPGDIVLDPLSGTGIVACEAVRLGRRGILIDINPMATFIAKMTLTPINLSRLQWAFRDLKSICNEAVSELFVTRCLRCGKDAEVEFVVRDGDISTQIAYKCNCSDKRLFKEPSERDKSLDRSFDNKEIPFWYPSNVLLPIIQRERFQFLHELFSRRNLIALSMILNAIEELEDQRIRDVMKLAFTAALDKCSRLKPLSRLGDTSRPSLSEGWVAVRFYAPREWQEVNPWHAFERSFERVYKGKKESNAKLKHVVLGSSYDDLRTNSANVVIFKGSADNIMNEELPEGVVDYVLTDPPYGAHIQYLALSTFWGAWLKFDFDYDRELTVNPYRGKTLRDYEHILGEILKAIKRVIRPEKYVHIFYHDVRGPYLHKMLRLMAESKVVPERVLHQPPPKSFGVAVRAKKGHYGSYIVRGRAIDKDISTKRDSVSENALCKKVSKAGKTALEIRGGSAPVGTLLHSIYQSLYGEEILMFAQHPAYEFIHESMGEFALVDRNKAQLKDFGKRSNANHAIKEEIRKALLDAKSLYVNNQKREDKKNQVYQRVSQRFQESGITIDDIRTVEQGISRSELMKHRKQRLLRILHLLGKLLNYECWLKNERENEIIWGVHGDVKISFRVTDKGILVKAFRAMPEGDIVSEVGSVSDENLENALLKWCQNHPKQGDKLKKDLNPMGEFTLPTKSSKHLLLKVLANKELCPDHYLIKLQIPKRQNLEDPRPGQFFHVICDSDGKKTLTDDGKERGYALTLRRPFSVHRIHYTNFDRRILDTPTITPYEIKEVIERPVSEIDILYKVVGEGTRNLSKVLPDRFLDLIGPIGNGFGIEKVHIAVIVAGGIGVAPLVALAERLRYLGSKIFLYFGAIKRELLRPILSRSDSAVDFGFANGTAEFSELINKEFRDIGTEEVKVCTDDGSLGEKGLVTDILERDIESGNLPNSDSTIYACGPTNMMKAVCRLADKFRMPCQVLLEERMACGIGACFSCTCHIRGKNGEEERKRVCVDGPVFNSEDIIWQS